MTGTYKLGLRTLSFVLCIVCIFALAQPAAAYVSELDSETPHSEKMVDASSADPSAASPQGFASIVHSAASQESGAVGYFEDGTRLSVKSETEDFYRVDCYGMDGYIAKSQVVRTENEEYYVNSKRGSEDVLLLEYVDAAEVSLLQNAFLNTAQAQLGSAYVFGGIRPGAFDCSGLTSYIYAQSGYSIHRGSTGQLRKGIIVAKEDLQVGDLVFFRETGEPNLTSHVGIYVGNRQIIHSGSHGVRYANLDVDYFAKYYVGARRIVSAPPELLAAVLAAGGEASACVRSVGSLGAAPSMARHN